MATPRYVLPQDCHHLALTGVDYVHPSSKEKVWRCDGCGYLAVPNGTGLLVQVPGQGYVYHIAVVEERPR